MSQTGPHTTGGAAGPPGLRAAGRRPLAAAPGLVTALSVPNPVSGPEEAGLAGPGLDEQEAAAGDKLQQQPNKQEVLHPPRFPGSSPAARRSAAAARRRRIPFILLLLLLLVVLRTEERPLSE
ncbi:unnamed protein product [Merluccius merluccius]